MSFQIHFKLIFVFDVKCGSRSVFPSVDWILVTEKTSLTGSRAFVQATRLGCSGPFHCCGLASPHARGSTAAHSPPLRV